VTRDSLRDYAERQRERYALATTRGQKRAILDEVVAVAKMHRKAAVPAAPAGLRGAGLGA